MSQDPPGDPNDRATGSEAFRKAHARAGGNGPRTFIGHPQFEGFEAVQTLLPDRRNVA